MSSEQEMLVPVVGGKQRLPSWWHGGGGHYAELLALREDVQRMNRSHVWMVRSGCVGIMLGVGSMLFCCVADDILGQEIVGFLCGIVVLLLGGLWCFALGICQQIANVDLWSRLWTQLVDAVRMQRVHVALLGRPDPGENEIEGRLRDELQVAARYVADGQRLGEPHLATWPRHSFVYG